MRLRLGFAMTKDWRNGGTQAGKDLNCSDSGLPQETPNQCERLGIGLRQRHPRIRSDLALLAI